MKDIERRVRALHGSVTLHVRMRGTGIAAQFVQGPHEATPVIAEQDEQHLAATVRDAGVWTQEASGGQRRVGS